MEAQKLALKIGDGVAVDALLNLSVRGLSVIVSIAVARTLTPVDYGAVSLALVGFGVMDALTDLSLGTALVRQPNLRRDSVDVAWTLGLVRSIGLSLLLLLGADLISRVFGHAEVVPYLKVLAFGTFTLHLGNLHLVRLHRELRFGPALLIESSRSVFGAIVSLVLLLTTHDAMSLAIGPVAGNALSSIATWIFISPRPRLKFSWNEARELMQFGRWFFGIGVLVYLFATLDSVYVGRYLGLAAAGVYAFAWRVVNTVMTLLTRSLAKMLTPAYASVQDNLGRMVEMARGALTIASAAGALLAGIVVVGAPDLFLVLGGGHTWDGSAPVARALTLSVYASVLNGALAPMFYAIGEPKTVTLTAVVPLVVLVPGLLLGHHFGGLAGVALGVALSALSRTAITGVWAARRFGLLVSDQLQAICPGVVVAAFVSALAMPVRLLPVHPLIRLMVLGLSCGLGFLLLWELGRRNHELGSRLPPLADPIRQVLQTLPGRLLSRFRAASRRP